MLRCLIVDDSPRFLDAARGLLEREGIAVGDLTAGRRRALPPPRSTPHEGVTAQSCA
ncbi:MAG: hypothetical protein JWN55_1398, partial [Frankiales bacterium]|nr:hypothetical protein [Frankiales bacterium]